jgi:hypothetical protein
MCLRALAGRVLVLTVSLLMASLLVYGQQKSGSISAILLKQYSKINWWHEYQRAHPDKEYGDSLVNANLKFQELLGKYGKIPSTLSANFKELKDAGIYVTTSEDRLFRIYSWDTRLGGTMRIFYNVMQYKRGNRVFTKAAQEKNFDAGKFYSKIYTHRDKGNAYYLACSSSIFSSRDIRQEISIFSISDKGLNENVKLIKTKSGLTDKLSLDYNFHSVADRKERPIELIKYDKDKGAIKLALVNDDLDVTNKLITYKFTGKYFEKQ